MAYFNTTVLDEQIKALPTVSTASGSVASFETDMTENLVKCVCEVASGSSEINVYATGKNLFDGKLPDISSTIKYRQIKLENGTYTMSTDCPLNTANASNVFFFGGYATSGASTATNGVYLNNSRTVTTTDGYITVAYRSASGVNPTNYTFQIEKGSYVTTYEAFGNTYNIPFGETLSGGGSFDVLSGILTRSDYTTKQLSANYIHTNNGINNIWCDTNGDTNVKYILSVGKAIS